MLKKSLLFTTLALVTLMSSSYSTHAATTTVKEQVTVKDYTKHPQRTAIEYVVKNKLMWLFPDGNFRPDQPITQADLVTGLVNVKGLMVGEPVQELPANHWAKVYYERAKKDGILELVTINPSKVLTREEAGLLMTNAWKSLRKRYKNPAQSYASVAVTAGWLPEKAGKLQNGVSTTKYDAIGGVTRSEEAAALYSLHRDFVGIIEGEKIANQFHSSLKISEGFLKGTVPTVKGYDIRLLIAFKNGTVKSIYSGAIDQNAHQIDYMQFTVQRDGESASLAIYDYTLAPPKIQRINKR